MQATLTVVCGAWRTVVLRTCGCYDASTNCVGATLGLNPEHARSSSRAEHSSWQLRETGDDGHKVLTKGLPGCCPV